MTYWSWSMEIERLCCENFRWRTIYISYKESCLKTFLESCTSQNRMITINFTLRTLSMVCSPSRSTWSHLHYFGGILSSCSFVCFYFVRNFHYAPCLVLLPPYKYSIVNPKQPKILRWFCRCVLQSAELTTFLVTGTPSNCVHGILTTISTSIML